MSDTAPQATLDALRRLLLAILFFGLLGTGTELILIGHDEDGLQMVPLVVLAIAVLASLMMVTMRSTSSALAATRLFRGAMVLLILSGATGSVLHFRAGMEFKREVDPSLSGFALFSSVVQAKAPPALSPGTLALLGLLGFACVFRLDSPASPRNS
jgi:multisubunit Na+/H+ antiporter MnhB subunit